jgi:hypothetical protein
LADEADCEQNAEEIMENLRLYIYLLERLLDFRKEQSNFVGTKYQTVADLRKECPSRVEKLELRANTSLQETSDVEKEQLRRDLRVAEEKVERLEEKARRLEAELIIARKLLEDKEADAVRAWKLKIKELVEREVRLHVIQKEQNVSDESSSESESKEYDDTSDGDITEHESRCRELNESRWNSYWESVEKFTTEGTSSRLPGAAATCGNYEATICEEEAASFTSVPSAASSEEGSTGREPVKCPICLREFSTQEVGTPESCNHSFCADCLQEWSENSNTCPVDREVYNAILVRAYLGGEVVRRIHVESRRQQVGEEVTEYMEHCEECGGGTDIEYGLLYCDACGQGYHLECVYPPLDTFSHPMEEWFCSNCSLPPPLYV